MISHPFRKWYNRTLALYVTIFLCIMYEGAMFAGCGGPSTPSNSYVYQGYSKVREGRKKRVISDTLAEQ